MFTLFFGYRSHPIRVEAPDILSARAVWDSLVEGGVPAISARP